MHETIESLRLYAETHVVSFEELKHMIDRIKPPIGDDPNYVLNQGPYRIVFSIEDQGERGMVRHVSVSVNLMAESPLKIAKDLNDILLSLGFVKQDPISIWDEDYGHGVTAKNYAQRIFQ